MTLSIQTYIDEQLLSEHDRLLAELERSRIALALLKKQIGVERMAEILQEPLAESTKQFEQWLTQSQGGYQVSKTVLKVKGLTVQSFVQWFHHARQADLLSANPEHYIVMPQGQGNTQEVCETLGCYGLPVHFRIRFTQDESIIPVPLEKGYDFNMLGSGETFADSKHMDSFVAHQFRNTEDGFEVLLQIIFPDSFPAELVKGHQMHLAIEFNHWVEMAYQAQ